MPTPRRTWPFNQRLEDENFADHEAGHPDGAKATGCRYCRESPPDLFSVDDPIPQLDVPERLTRERLCMRHLVIGGDHLVIEMGSAKWRPCQCPASSGGAITNVSIYASATTEAFPGHTLESQSRSSEISRRSSLGIRNAT